MSTFKKITLKLFVLLILFNGNLYAKQIPNSFADLAEKLMPSVVNISTTQTIKTQANPFPFQFPPGWSFKFSFQYCLVSFSEHQVLQQVLSQVSHHELLEIGRAHV